MFDIANLAPFPFDPAEVAPRLPDKGRSGDFEDHLGKAENRKYRSADEDTKSLRGHDRADPREDAARSESRASRSDDPAETNPRNDERADQRKDEEGRTGHDADDGAGTDKQASANETGKKQERPEEKTETGTDAKTAATTETQEPEGQAGPAQKAKTAGDASQHLKAGNSDTKQPGAGPQSANAEPGDVAATNGKTPAKEIGDPLLKMDAPQTAIGNAENADPIEIDIIDPALNGLGRIARDMLSNDLALSDLPELLPVQDGQKPGAELRDVLAHLLSRQTGKPFVQSINIQNPAIRTDGGTQPGLQIGLKLDAPNTPTRDFTPLPLPADDGGGELPQLPVMRTAPNPNLPPMPQLPSHHETQQLGQFGNTHSSSPGTGQVGGTNAATMGAGPVARPAPVETGAGIQIAIHLSRAIQDGIDRLSVRLNPPELGRVDIRLEVAHDGRAIAVVTADRQETLDLLQRDSRGLERALLEAGLKADSNSLNFNLRQNGENASQASTGSDVLPEGMTDEDGQNADRPLPRIASDRLLDISV